MPYRNRLNNWFILGYKFCGECRYIINTKETYCAYCGRKFRTKVVNKKRSGHNFKESYSFNGGLNNEV